MMNPFDGSSPFEEHVRHFFERPDVHGALGRCADKVEEVALFLWEQVLPPAAGSISYLHWLYLMTTVAVLVVLYTARRGRGAKGIDGRETARGFFEYVFPRGYYFHPSSRMDLKLYAFYAVWSVLLLLIAFDAIGDHVTRGLAHGLVAAFGQSPGYEATFGLKLLYTFALIVGVDTAFFFTHLAEHRIPILWEVHKVHHSAEVLTPLTRARVHPFADLYGSPMLACGFAVPTAIFQYLVPDIATIDVMSAPIFFVLYDLTSNLRHHHVQLRFPRAVERWIQSPAMHHVHHSTRPEHWNKNLGLVFSYWDRLFGTLYIHDKDEPTPWGFNVEEHHKYRTLSGLLKTPIVNSWRLLRGGHRHRGT
jgi:sterol desaturase/sphingolipid hydroxylase (fatty acid hydroxylase superfamily)